MCVFQRERESERVRRTERKREKERTTVRGMMTVSDRQIGDKEGKGKALNNKLLQKEKVNDNDI